MPPKPKFADGEKVLCFHGPLMYEAKTIKYEVKDKTIRYLVHYNGWNKSWDEWVPETRVLKNDENALRKQRELKKSHEAKMKTARANKKKGVDTDSEKDDKPSKARKVSQDSEKDEKPSKSRKDIKERSATPTIEKKKTEEKKRGPKEKQKKEEKEKAKDKDKDEDWDTISTQSEEGSTSSRKRSRAAKDKIKEPENTKKDKESSKKEKDKEKEKEKEVEKDKEKESKKDEDDGPKKKRIRGESHVEMEDSFMTKIEVKIKIPDELKPWLVDDWDLIVRQKNILNVPCKNNVDTILDEFLKSKEAKGPHPQRDAILEIIQGIKDYFNVMLGSQLLYKFERAQYAELLADHPDKSMSQIYGPIHLLRLFVRLGSMLAYTPQDDKSMQLLLFHIHDFLKYMSKNAMTLFSLSEYVVAPPEYHRRAM